MNPLANPKGSLWLCRLVPLVTWSLWLATLLTYDRSREGLTIAGALLIVSLVAYLPLVYFVLPIFLFGGTPLGIAQKVGYFLFAGVTAGLGPIVWYFVSVDWALRDMTENRRRNLRP